MIRKTLLVLALVAAPALAQQPTQQPTTPAKPARTTAAQRADTSKAKAHRTRRAHAKPKPAAPRDTTAKP